MYLKKLEILGFKSFQQKTEIKFHKGMTAIVGPNGCGKTNIVDAIRWCLGEQKISTLRSDKMENVIFNGTANRKPMGMAEVSLTIENDKGILPTEYSEVTITRRIFRSGESEYLLNKNLCRLKDINNLFMDTGMGANAYSVIELKMIETILSSKAEERRILFEEAAGVNKYKLRRRLTLKKLEDVKADLTRVNDIVSEVEKKVNSLERQAKRADKFNNLSSTLRELEIDLAERELAQFNQNKNLYKIEKENLIEERISIDSVLSGLDDEIKLIKNDLSLVEDKLKERRDKISAQIDIIHKLQQAVSVSEERKNSLEKNIKRLEEEIKELSLKRTNLENNLEENKLKINEVSNEIDNKLIEKEEIKNLVEKQKEILDQKNYNLKLFNEEQLIKFKEISSKENELTNLQNLLDRTNENINKLNHKIQTLTDNIAKTVKFIEELNDDKEDTKRKLSEAEELLTQKQKEKEELEKRLTEFKEKDLKERSLLNTLSEKINFIKNLIDKLEGFSKGAKALLENKIHSSDWSNIEKDILANLGNAKEGYNFAIEAALRNNINNIILNTIEDLQKGVQYLIDNDFGKASFYVADLVNNKKKSFVEKIFNYSLTQKRKKLEKENGFVGWANEFIQTQEKWKSIFDEILFNTAIIENFNSAINLSKKYNSFDFATLNGDFVHHSGIIEAGSLPKLDDSIFGRKQLLENLKMELSQREKILNEIKNEIEILEEKISSIDLKVLSEKGRILINDLANVEKQIAQFEFEKQKAIDEIDKTQDEIKELVYQTDDYINKKNILFSDLNLLREEKEKSDNEKKQLEEEFEIINQDYTQLIAQQNQINLELERLSGQKKNLESSIIRNHNDIEETKNSIQKRNSEILKSNEEMISLSEIIAKNKEELSNLNAQKIEFTNELNSIQEEYDSIKKIISEKETQQNETRKRKESIGESLHQLEMKLNEIDYKIQSLRENIRENYSLELELKNYDDLDSFDFPKRIDDVHSLKQQIKNLGPINLLAYSEYEEEKQRFEFLSKQQTDLIESEKDLVKTIEEINTTAQTLFLDTFQKIRENFINIFRSLFNPGDEADLKLEENVDPLEAKIEIIAKPKGKRPTTIELLSGGEKTLTAIALLFSIYLVKPSPFCILDEIDAPLDDANIDRFTKILKDFSQNTQFIVVTHNKRTMESCDTLYGVTMQEEGVSKIVSVRFNEDIIVN